VLFRSLGSSRALFLVALLRHDLRLILQNRRRMFLNADVADRLANWNVNAQEFVPVVEQRPQGGKSGPSGPGGGGKGPMNSMGPGGGGGGMGGPYGFGGKGWQNSSGGMMNQVPGQWAKGGAPDAGWGKGASDGSWGKGGPQTDGWGKGSAPDGGWGKGGMPPGAGAPRPLLRSFAAIWSVSAEYDGEVMKRALANIDLEPEIVAKLPDVDGGFGLVFLDSYSAAAAVLALDGMDPAREFIKQNGEDQVRVAQWNPVRQEFINENVPAVVQTAMTTISQQFASKLAIRFPAAS